MKVWSPEGKTTKSSNQGLEAKYQSRAEGSRGRILLNSMRHNDDDFSDEDTKNSQQKPPVNANQSNSIAGIVSFICVLCFLAIIYQKQDIFRNMLSSISSLSSFSKLRNRR